MTLPSTYQHVNVTDDGDQVVEKPVRKSCRLDRYWLVAILVGVLIGAVFMLVTVRESAPKPSLELEGQPRGHSENKVRSCTFEECYASGCNHESAPYECLLKNGGPHGGCSEVAWTPESCDDQCNLSLCDTLSIPDDVDTCESVQCNPDWCRSDQLCGTAVPFQCTDGSGRFGCSDDALHWTLRSADVVCSTCCDSRTCL